MIDAEYFAKILVAVVALSGFYGLCRWSMKNGRTGR